MYPKDQYQKFVSSDTDTIVAKLTQLEKISLLAGTSKYLQRKVYPSADPLRPTGKDWWQTAAVPSVGMPSVKMSDGPNGVRGQ